MQEEKLADEKERKNKKIGFEINKKKVVAFAWAEALILFVVMLICRLSVFPKMAKVGELHTRIALECFGTGMTVTIISIMALSVKRAWKTKGIYVVYPLIFFLFAIGLLMVTNEINFG